MSKWAADKIITFDIETAGDLPEYALQPWRVKQNKARITSYAAFHKDKMRGSLNPTHDELEKMLRYAADNNVAILGWNIVFDISWLIAYGFEDLVFKIKWLDGMLMWKHAVIEPEYETAKKKSYGLKTAVAELYPDQAGYEDGVIFDQVDEKLLEYNKKDVQFTYDISKHWFEKLTPRQQKCLFIEAESLPLIAQANVNGMLVDLEAAKSLEADLDKKAAELLEALSPHGVTEKIIRSPKQLGDLIYKTWALPCEAFTKSGTASTDKEALHELSFIDPRAKLLKEYREALNNRTKFAQTIINSVAYNEDGHTYPLAIPFGTYSGRLTYSSNQGRGKDLRQTGFALHQTKRGKEYRQLIKAPEGFTLVEFDAANQEYRLMAIASDDPVMQKLCAPGQDPHAYMGVQINPNAEDKKAARQLGKIANLSLGYRTSAKKLKSVARVQYGLPMELPEAQEIHQAYQDTYKQVPIYWQTQINKTKQAGFVETYAGRRVQMKDNWKHYEWSMGSTAINYRIQATASDMKFLALKHIKPYLRTIGGRFAWDLHDGLYFYIPSDVVADAVVHIKQLLDNLPYAKEWGSAFQVALPWDCKTGLTWGDLTEYDFTKGKGGDPAKDSPPSSLPNSTQDLEDKGSNKSLNAEYTESPKIIQADFRPPNEYALSVALDLAHAGLKVFPCQADKSPVSGFMNWENAASFDEAQLKTWFLDEYRQTAVMVGLPTGANQLVAIDPDRPKPEKKKYADGLELFQSLIAERQIDLTSVPVIVSPSGGQHYFFAQPIEAGALRFGCTTGALPDNIDVKGDGGYVIASGSRRHDGKLYAPMPGTPELLEAFVNGDIPQMPEALAELIGFAPATKQAQQLSQRIPKNLLSEAFLDHNIANDHNFDSRTDWINMLHAIYAASAGEIWGRRIWVAWNSCRDQKPGEVERVWDSLRGYNVRSLGAGYIKQCLMDRGRLDLLERISLAEAAKIFVAESSESEGSDSESENPFYKAAVRDGDSAGEPVSAIVKGLVTAKGLTFIAGQPNAGKSAIAVNLAVCLAAGLDFAGHRVRGGGVGVLYVAAEAPGSIFDRFKATKDCLFIGSDVRLPITTLPLVPDLSDKKARELFLRALILAARDIQERFNVGIGAFIIDTMAQAFSMDDENSAAEMGKLIRAINDIGSSLGCARVVVHHMGKNVDAGMRGSTSLLGAADDELDVLVDASDATTRNYPVMVHKKSRNYARGKDMGFMLSSVSMGVDEDGDQITTVCAQYTGDITHQDEEAILQRIKDEEPREDSRSPHWVGHIIAEFRGLDPSNPQDKAKIKDAIRDLVRRKKIKSFTLHDTRNGRDNRHFTTA
jgi:hypothetical protein